MNDAFLPLRFTLTAGARHDVTEAPALVAGYKCEYVIADAAYDSDAFRETIVGQGAVAVIRPRKNRVEDRPYDEEVYKRRNVIERFFHRLKQSRRVATRYDKYAVRYLGSVSFSQPRSASPRTRTKSTKKEVKQDTIGGQQFINPLHAPFLKLNW